MNKRLKKSLQASFAAPPPKHKAEFLKLLSFPKTTYREFLFSQLRYIRKRVWTVSVLIVLTGWMLVFWSPVFSNWNSDASKIWNLSAVLPFLAMLSVAEIYRSAAFHMAELESCCRFSLTQIIMARITILGGGNFAILLLFFIFMNQISAYSILQIIVYMMVPYLLVCSFCLWMLNHARGQEGVFGCTAIVFLVCAGSILFKDTATLLYENAYIIGWLAAFASSCVLIAVQLRKLLNQKEDNLWNLFLIE